MFERHRNKKAGYLKRKWNKHKDDVKAMNIYITNLNCLIDEEFKKVDTKNVINEKTVKGESKPFEYKIMKEDGTIEYKKGSMIDGMLEVRKMIIEDYNEITEGEDGSKYEKEL